MATLSHTNPDTEQIEVSAAIELNDDCEEIQAYQDLVNEMADNKSKEILPNAGKLHAAIVMAKLFEKTSTSVSMVVGSMDGKVSGQANYMDQLEKCIERNASFKVLFLENPNTESKAFKLLLKKRDEGYPIAICQSNAEVISKFSKKKKVHFAIFDDDKFRFEKDTENYLAWVCFNNKKETAELINIFDSIFPLSTPI